MLRGQTPGGAKGGMAQEGMIWKLVPEDVIGKPAEFTTNADFGFMWRVQKDTKGSGNGRNVDKAWMESLERSR